MTNFKAFVFSMYLFLLFRPSEEKAKITGYVETVVPLYDDETFRRMFRMSRPTFDVLCTYLKDLPDFAYDHSGGKEHITVEKQTLMGLWYFGSSDTIERMADRFGVSLSTVIRCRDRLVHAINNNLRKFISWPDQQTLQEQADQFSQRNGFPGIVGALDGCHIEIKEPGDHSKSYINRKGFASLQLQAVCNYNMLFTHVFLGYPGSCHDARVLRNSDLWTSGSNMCRNVYHIIADAAYPIRGWLLTPFRDNGHLTQNQKRYNQYLSSNRVVIDRAFALLKGRFRRLKYLDTNKVENAVEIIMACCIVHNICLLSHDEVGDFLEQGLQDHVNIQNPNQFQDIEGEGVLKRNIIMGQLV